VGALLFRSVLQTLCQCCTSKSRRTVGIRIVTPLRLCSDSARTTLNLRLFRFNGMSDEETEKNSVAHKSWLCRVDLKLSCINTNLDVPLCDLSSIVNSQIGNGYRLRHTETVSMRQPTYMYPATNRTGTTRGLLILIARLTARKHNRIFLLCHYFASRNKRQQFESVHI
jgi:hypothetical protein